MDQKAIPLSRRPYLFLPGEQGFLESSDEDAVLFLEYNYSHDLVSSTVELDYL